MIIPLRMHARDLPEVVRAERMLFSFPWTEGNFRDAIAAGYDAWILRDSQSNALQAYAVTMTAVDEVHLLNLSVERDWQGKGFGRALLAWLLTRARSHEMSSMLLEVRPSNQVAVALYESVGFQTIGLRKAYYPAAIGREDAQVMRYLLKAYPS